MGYITLKQLPEDALKCITDLFNYLLNAGYFPKAWKNAIGVMIQEPQKDPRQVGSYRPISLLQYGRCLGKLFEKCIAYPLIDYLYLCAWALFGWGTGGHVPPMFLGVGDKRHFVPPPCFTGQDFFI